MRWSKYALILMSMMLSFISYAFAADDVITYKDERSRTTSFIHRFDVEGEGDLSSLFSEAMDRERSKQWEPIGITFEQLTLPSGDPTRELSRKVKMGSGKDEFIFQEVVRKSGSSVTQMLILITTKEQSFQLKARPWLIDLLVQKAGANELGRGSWFNHVDTPAAVDHLRRTCKAQGFGSIISKNPADQDLLLPKDGLACLKSAGAGIEMALGQMVTLAEKMGTCTLNIGKTPYIGSVLQSSPQLILAACSAQMGLTAGAAIFSQLNSLEKQKLFIKKIVSKIHHFDCLPSAQQLQIICKYAAPVIAQAIATKGVGLIVANVERGFAATVAASRATEVAEDASSIARAPKTALPKTIAKPETLADVSESEQFHKRFPCTAEHRSWSDVLIQAAWAGEPCLVKTNLEKISDAHELAARASRMRERSHDLSVSEASNAQREAAQMSAEAAKQILKVAQTTKDADLFKEAMFEFVYANDASSAAAAARAAVQNGASATSVRGALETAGQHIERVRTEFPSNAFYTRRSQMIHGALKNFEATPEGRLPIAKAPTAPPPPAPVRPVITNVPDSLQLARNARAAGQSDVSASHFLDHAKVQSFADSSYREAFTTSIQGSGKTAVQIADQAVRSGPKRVTELVEQLEKVSAEDTTRMSTAARATRTENLRSVVQELRKQPPNPATYQKLRDLERPLLPDSSTPSSFAFRGNTTKAVEVAQERLRTGWSKETVLKDLERDNTTNQMMLKSIEGSYSRGRASKLMLDEARKRVQRFDEIIQKVQAN